VKTIARLVMPALLLTAVVGAAHARNTVQVETLEPVRCTLDGKGAGPRLDLASGKEPGLVYPLAVDLGTCDIKRPHPSSDSPAHRCPAPPV
jgi:hypothetical protein